MLLLLLFPAVVTSIKPQIEILPGPGKIFDFQNETITVLTNWHPEFELVCTENYPVEWKLNFEWKRYASIKKATQIESYRQVENFTNPMTYKYMSRIRFKYDGNWEKLTNFSCQATMHDTAKIKTKSVHVIMSKQGNNGTLVLILQTSPYLSSSISSSVDNVKENCTETEIVATMVRPVENLMPCWKCMNAKTNITLEIAIDYCDSPTECTGFYDNRNKGALCLRREENVFDNCTVPRHTWDFNPKLFVCKNEGPKLKHHFFFGVFRGNRNNLALSVPPLYMNWAEADPQQMLYIHPLKTSICYLKEEITITCEYSRYYFALGSWFGIKHIQEMQYFPATDVKPCDLDNKFESNCTKRGAWRGTYKAEHKIIFNETGQYEIFCFGPVWNSTEWINTSMIVDVVMGEAPKITFLQPFMKGGFKLGQLRRLICKFTGNPVPNVKWTWTNQQASPTITRIGDYASELKFTEVGYSSEGIYTCKVENCEGLDSASFDFTLEHVPVWNLVTMGLILLAYVVGVVCLHVKGVINGQRSKLQKLTRKEIEKFLKGDPQLLEEFGDSQLTITALEALPYDEKLEIPLKDITIYTHLVLGSGAYGQVFKGQINSASVEERINQAIGSTEAASNKIDVAVKVGKEDLDKVQMKTLLAEIKVMSYMGFHKNVVSLIGASTCKLAKMELYIIMEYCHNGSLDVYLRYNKRNLESLGGNYNGVEGLLNRNNLFVWASEIADGLEYMHGKRIIHADLAIRNVLLTKDLTAKIGDFGLSKQLANTSIYTKKTKHGLPWRYMAIESLKELEFTVQSDIWGFGVLLWELFTLGEVPYPSYSFSPEFISDLEAGHRLEQPSLATNSMYEFMRRCWNNDRTLRPNLNQITEICNQAITTTET